MVCAKGRGKPREFGWYAGSRLNFCGARAQPYPMGSRHLLPFAGASRIGRYRQAAPLMPGEPERTPTGLQGSVQAVLTPITAPPIWITRLRPLAALSPAAVCDHGDRLVSDPIAPDAVIEARIVASHDDEAWSDHLVPPRHLARSARLASLCLPLLVVF